MTIRHSILISLLATIIVCCTHKRLHAQGIDPSNTAYLVKLNDTLYMDIAEVNLLRWLEFSQATRGNTQPDSAAVSQKPYQYLLAPQRIGCRQLAVDGEFSRIKLDVRADSLAENDQKQRIRKLVNLPVTGITYEQAKAFCRWRTHQYNESKYGISDSTKYKIRFDLPEPWMYELVLTSLDSLDKCATFNYKAKPCRDKKLREEEEYKMIGREVLRVNTMDLSERNLFHVRGNAAEMTNRKGTSKGGSYHHYARAAHPKAVVFYKNPEPWLGFRCVAIVMAPLPAPKYKTILE